MSIVSQLTKRFYNLASDGNYYNELNKKFVIKDKSNTRKLQKTIVLDGNEKQILRPAELKNFREVCLLEKKCLEKLGEKKYHEAYQILPEGQLLCQLYMLYTKTGNIGAKDEEKDFELKGYFEQINQELPKH